MEFYLKITDKMLKEMDEDFKKWSFQKLFPEDSEENDSLGGSAKTKFIIFKPFVIEQAQKGASRKFVFNYLKERNKISGTYDTFLRHLRKYNVDQYFSDAYHRAPDILNNKIPPPTIPSPSKKSEGIEANSSTANKETTTRQKPEKPFVHSPSLPKEKLEELMGKADEDPPKSKKNPFFS